MFYNNKDAWREIRRLKQIYGERMTQTNSRCSGNWGIVRIYATPEDRGHPDRALITLETLAELRAHKASHP